MCDICAIQQVLSCRAASFCSLDGHGGTAPAQPRWTEQHFITTSWNLFPPELQQFPFAAAPELLGFFWSAPEKFLSGPWKLWGAEGSVERMHGGCRSAALAEVLCPTFPLQVHQSSVYTQEAPSTFPPIFSCEICNFFLSTVVFSKDWLTNDRHPLLLTGATKPCNFHETGHQDFPLILQSFSNTSTPAKPWGKGGLLRLCHRAQRWGHRPGSGKFVHLSSCSFHSCVPSYLCAQELWAANSVFSIICLIIYTDYLFVLAKHSYINFINSKKPNKNQREDGEIRLIISE